MSMVIEVGWYKTDMVMMVMIWMHDCVMMVEGFQVFQATVIMLREGRSIELSMLEARHLRSTTVQLYCLARSFDT